MTQIEAIPDRRTSADIVFEELLERIVSLELLPGRKMSEVDVASQFGVSRQPVRDAFSKLETMGLLLIRPQKATVVRKFSTPTILNARFVRTAVEIEVLRRGVQDRDTSVDTLIEANLEEQGKAIEALDPDKFHALDYDFHQLLCRSADCMFAFKNISESKAQVDRLCMLSISHKQGMKVLLEDHRKIYTALTSGDEEGVMAATRTHLARLDATIESVRESYGEYFED